MTVKKKLSSFLSLLPAPDHLGAGDIALLVDKIQISVFLSDANLGHLARLAALFVAPGHKRARDIALLVNKVQIPFLLFNTDLLHFFCCHRFTSLLSLYSFSHSQNHWALGPNLNPLKKLF